MNSYKEHAIFLLDRYLLFGFNAVLTELPNSSLLEINDCVAVRCEEAPPQVSEVTENGEEYYEVKVGIAVTFLTKSTEEGEKLAKFLMEDYQFVLSNQQVVIH